MVSMDVHEIYALSKYRSKKILNIFLDEFLPKRVELSENYSYPEYEESPEEVFAGLDSIIDKLIADKNSEYSLYWGNSTDSEVKNAMVFFLSDGGMIVGLAVDAEKSEAMMEHLARVVNARYGYEELEGFLPESTLEFINLCESANTRRIIDGVVVTEGN